MRLLILGLLVSFGSRAQGLPVEINITLTNKEAKGKIYLEQINDRGFGEKIDSVQIAGGPFVFQTSIPEPGIYQLNIANDQQIGLLLDGGEKLVIKAEGITPEAKAPEASVEGSEAMKMFNELQDTYFGFMGKVKDIDAKFRSSSNEATRAKLREQYLELLKNHNTAILDKVKSLGTSAAGILATNNFLSSEVSGEYFDELAGRLQKEGNKSRLAMLFVQQVNKDKMGQPGIEAPDFTLRNLKGEVVKLSELRGKLVILDFWATWCGPCLMSFPGMKKAMEKYAGRDDVAFVYVNTFERVPVETTKEYVTSFVDRRGLSYLNPVLDEGHEVAFLYGVESIPTRFYIDKEGKFLSMSRGFAGTDDAVVEEVSQWLDK
ncbi:redoxin domain-containing protein [Leadbetterella sp. DM7]|uniref:redoxin domain-containing protein n=1 Tax=Leadbetterella sp. DM7 TaxID=3235085 RepID=UPI00349E8210